jgi:transcriptional regulator with XRE-family HTH domain
MNLRETRQKAMMSQRELAEKSNITHVTISRIETGINKNPNYATRRALTKALGVDSIDW